MNTIAITGATGFVGGHLVRHFYKEGYNIIALGRQSDPPKRLLQYAQWQQMDLDQPLDNIDANIVIHTAGLVDDHASYQDLHKTNCVGSGKVSDAFSGQHMIYISSASVYNLRSNPLSENDKIDRSQLSLYGKSKLEAEELLIQKSNNKQRLTILRPRAIYGTHDRVLLPKILGLLKGNKIRSIGNMEIEISMTHINNLIIAVEGSIENQTKTLEIFNVADSHVYNLREVILHTTSTLFDIHPRIASIPKSLAEWIKKITALLHIKTPITRQAIDYLSQPCVLSTSKIEKIVGYKSKHYFQNEINNIHEWVQRVGTEIVISKDKRIPWMV